MASKKDKDKTLDEVWTEERVKSFLDAKPAASLDADFHILLKAYQSMRLDNFEDFVGYFVAEGRNINATNPDGQTVLSIVKQHDQSAGYAEVLTANGGS